MEKEYEDRNGFQNREELVDVEGHEGVALTVNCSS